MWIPPETVPYVNIWDPPDECFQVVRRLNSVAVTTHESQAGRIHELMEDLHALILRTADDGQQELISVEEAKTNCE